jgi:PAS domain S-box-containing protein/putative nucleotidyltransferase with HDIG domain
VQTKSRTSEDLVEKLVRELANKGQFSQVRPLQSFIRMLMSLADSSSEDDAFQIIGEALLELVPDSVVSINSFEEKSACFRVRAIVGADTRIADLAKILGTHPVGISLAINDEARRELGSGTLKKVPGGFRELTMGAIPKSVCTAVEKLLDIGEVYAVGFTWDGKLLGSASFLLQKDANPIDPRLVKTFVSLASLVLQRWRSEEALRESEQTKNETLQRYNRIVQMSTDMIFTVDLDGNFLSTNKAIHSQLGYSQGEIKKINGFQLLHPDDLNRVQRRFASLRKGRRIQNMEYRYRRKDGSYMTILNSSCPIFGLDRNVVGAFGISRDISGIKKREEELREHHDNLEKLVAERTHELRLLNKRLQHELLERKQAEEATRKSKQQLEDLLATAPVVMCRADLKGKVTYVNRKFEDITGYSKSEVVGKHWPTLGIIPIGVDVLMHRTSEKLSGRPASPMEVAVRCKDGQLKYVSGIGEVIKENGKPVGVQVIAQDITQRKEAEEQADRSTQQLLKALEDMVEALAMTVESRDPYTAGHQRRVAQIACAIAADMGLAEDQLVGIRLAGLIHDVGKVRVPSEILTNPDGLTEAEMRIVRTHPMVGHEILKNIEFPWPIAQAVLQHHERLDGSGYPSGLSKEQIITEARILAVADVVEAMASHRPYRPSLGIDEALNEIECNRGRLYDSAAVDSCVRLFKNNGFKFEDVKKVRD